MANKRNLKKQIRFICGDIAGECIMAKYFIPGVDKAKLDEIILQVADLQTTALARANASFDKTPADFANRAEYRKAHRAYYAKAFKSLSDGFTAQVEAIVKEMNKALPKK